MQAHDLTPPAGACVLRILTAFVQLSVMVREIVNHGVCDLPNDKIAGLAGGGVTLVKNTRRHAKLLGWITVIPRPRQGQKSLTTLVYALSAELQAWISTRCRMIGGKSVATAQTRYSNTLPKNPRKGFRLPERGSTRGGPR
jgi:hypothetical protein